MALTKKSVHPPIKMIVFADNQPHIKDEQARRFNAKNG
jgi:hypothetical protein